MSDRACQECISAVEEDYTVHVQAMYAQLNRTAVDMTASRYFGDISAVLFSVTSPPKGRGAEISLSVEIGSLPDASLRVHRPIPITLTFEESIWTAEQKEFGISATGDAQEDAQLSLAEYVSEDFVHWERTPEDQLSEDAKNLLARYRAYIAVIE